MINVKAGELVKILLILPYDTTYRYEGFFKRSISYAPLTLTTLAALVPPGMNAEIDIIDEGVQKPTYHSKSYDIVGITCVASSAPRAYLLAEYWKKRGAFVVLGGAHPTLMPEEASKYADSVVVGPGEESWPQLLLDYKDGKAQKIYSAAKSDFSACPVPRRDLLPKGKYLSVPTVIANRGCKNACRFCCINRLWGGKGNTRPIEKVVEEVKSLNTKRILLLDPSPNSDKEYSKELLKSLIPLKIKWGGLSTIDIVDDPELLELTVKSGCEGLLIGFESINQSNICMTGKTFNNTLKYKEAVKTLHKNGICVLGCFILGFDNDTAESLLQLPDIVDDFKIDIPRFAVLTPFPGTEIYSGLKAEKRILSEDWALYDSNHVVFRPKQLVPSELQKVYFEVWEKTYSIQRIIKRVVSSCRDKTIMLTANIGFGYYSGNIKRQGKEYIKLLTQSEKSTVDLRSD